MSLATDKDGESNSMRPAALSKLDCVVRVVTPENIEFEYFLAGPFQRLPAFAFDVFFRSAVFFALFMIIQFSGALLGLGGMQWLIAFGFILLYFLISWFYGIFMETTFNGRTLGKMVFRLRVISVDGHPISAAQATVRNLLRSADFAPLLPLQIFGSEAPPAYLIPTLFLGLLSMILTRRMQRVGDLAAGTMVIANRQSGAPTVFQPDDERAFALAEFIPPTFQVSRGLSKAIGMYMEARKRFSPGRRSELAGHLARPLIGQMGLMPDTSPDLLLCAVYARTFMSEEHRATSLEKDRLSRSRLVAATPPVVSSWRSSASVTAAVKETRPMEPHANCPPAEASSVEDRPPSVQER